jgi:hypothetical protein
MDNEKKIKLEELPDKGSEPDKIVFTPVAKSRPEPRLEKLKTLNNAEKIEAIGQSWFFDKQIKRWGWLYVLLLLLVLEKSGHMSAFDKKRKQYRAEGDKASEMVLDMFSFEFMLVHPLYLAVLIPLFFKFHGPSKLFFEITFYGVNGVRTIADQDKEPQRVFTRWDDILMVEKIVVEGRSVIQIHNAKGPHAQLIWDIEDIKKKVVKQVLKGLISNQHPLRIFIEKEVA